MTEEIETGTETAIASSISSDKPNLTEEHFGLISQAYDEFIRKSYNQTLKTLTQLEELMGSNSKILHNRAIVEFYNSGCKDYKKLLQFLDEQINNFKSEYKNNRNILVLYLNKAIIFYQLRKSMAAIDLLTLVIEKFDELDEPISLKAGLLFLTLLLETNQLKKAYRFLKTFETYVEQHAETNITPDEENSLDLTNTSNICNNFKITFKLISRLIYIINCKSILLPEETTVEFSILKAHQYYVGKDFQMAAKQLSKNFSGEFSLDTNGEDPDTCIANNMGVIHLRVRHYAIATKFFQTALCFDNKIVAKLNDGPLHILGAMKKPEILYNLGIAMLHLQRPKEAFDCFMLPLRIFHQNPRLWLRVAESCIMVYEIEKRDSEKKGVISSTIGSGIHRKYLLNPTPKIKSSDLSVNDSSSTNPSPTLEFAYRCLRNAVTLAEQYKATFSMQVDTEDEHQNENWKNVKDENFCNPSPPITMESLDRLIAAIYAAYSYVAIRLADYVIGLEYAKKLLQLENLSDANVMLGHLYCAEALINLDKISEARLYLEPKFITNLNPHDFETKDWEINSIDAAQAVLRYNLVVTLVLQGEFGVAKALLVSCNHPVLATKYKMLKMFIDLAGDNSTDSSAKSKTPRF